MRFRKTGGLGLSERAGLLLDCCGACAVEETGKRWNGLEGTLIDWAGLLRSDKEIHDGKWKYGVPYTRHFPRWAD